MVSDLTGIILAGLGLALVGLVWFALQPPVIGSMVRSLNEQHERQNQMQEEIDALRHEQAEDRLEMEELRLEMAEWRSGMRLVFEQMRQAHITPAWEPREHEPSRPRSSLAERIATQFNLEEINSLAFDVGLDSEAIKGETREARARELLKLAERRNKLKALRDRVSELRPKG